MYNKEYMKLLFKQYVSAKGPNLDNMSTREIMHEYAEFISELNILGQNYLTILESMGININDKTVVEIGKGKLDTISKDKTTIITPYTEGFKKDNRTVLTSEIKVCKYIPKLLDIDGRASIDISSLNIKTFITQNPYDGLSTSNFGQLANNENYDVIIGVYGDTSDRNYMKKVEELKRLKSRLTQFKEKFEKQDGAYFYALIKTK